MFLQGTVAKGEVNIGKAEPSVQAWAYKCCQYERFDKERIPGTKFEFCCEVLNMC